MKTLLALGVMTFVLTCLQPSRALAQKTESAAAVLTADMKTYLIERDIPGASGFADSTLKAISRKSCSVLKEMGPGIQWVQSYVAGNKIFCVYRAESEELLRTHAKKGGFPITSITPVSNVISPRTAE